MLVFPIGRKEIDGVGMAEACGIQVAAERLFVGKDNDDLFMSRGWGAVFQRNQSVSIRIG